MTQREIHIGPQEGPQTEFLRSTADIVIFGGAAGGGKSYALLLDAWRYAIDPHNMRGYRATLFRKTFSQIEQPGGLKETSDDLYPWAGAEFHKGRMTWTFPCGAKVSFNYMEHEQDKLKYQGAQIPWIGFDELTHFTSSMFFYMLSRNRSVCGAPSRIRATCNPDSSSWVAELIEWWIDQDTGYPIAERSGVVRWFVRLENVMHWGNSPTDLWKKVKDYYDGDPTEFLPKSLTFIGSKLADNRILTEKDPSYKANLMAMSQAEQDILLHGNWLVSMNEGAEWEDCPHYFDRHIWTSHWPDNFICSAMFIDPSKGKSDRSDPSAIVFVGLKGGQIYIWSDIRRRPAEQIVSDALDIYLELKPSVLCVEGNAGQDLLLPMFFQECDRRQLPPIKLDTLWNSEKKEVRIKSLGTYLEHQKFLLHKDCKSNRILYDQLKNFGIKGVNDDGPDALDGALRTLMEYGVNPMELASDAIEEDDADELDFEFVSI